MWCQFRLQVGSAAHLATQPTAVTAGSPSDDGCLCRQLSRQRHVSSRAARHECSNARSLVACKVGSLLRQPVVL
jgi:hypothetical protein